MNVAYLILSHTDPTQLNNLISALEHPNFDFFIHVDKKKNIKLFKEKTSSKNNVFFLEDEARVDIYWAGFNMVKATLNLLNEANKTKKYNRFVLLSGLDYPIKSPRYIYDFFKENTEIEYIDAFDINGCENHKVEKFWFFDLPIKNDRIRKLIWKFTVLLISKNPLINNKKKLQINNEECTVFFSSQWIALTDKCVDEIIETIELNPHILQYFKYSYAPDELFFATLVGNSRFKKNMINYQRNKCSYRSPLHVIEYHEKVKTYTGEDVSELLNSPKLFCRKVETGKSDKLIELLSNMKG